MPPRYEFPAPIHPRSKDDALACMVLFALNWCSGDRTAFKFSGEGSQVFAVNAARAIIDHFAIECDPDDVPGFCSWLRYRRNDSRAIRVEYNYLEYPSFHTNACNLCGVRNRHCQFPSDWSAILLPIQLDITGIREPGYCIINHCSRYIIDDTWVWDRPTGWPALDRPMREFSKGPWEGIEYKPPKRAEQDPTPRRARKRRQP